MSTPDRGPELLAYLLDQLPADERAALERELERSSELREELERLRATPELLTPPSSIEPPAGGFARLLAAVQDEAAERRARYAAENDVASPASRATPAPVDDELGAELVAFALGQSDAQGRDRVEAELSRTPQLQDEIAAIESLVTSARAAAIPAPADGRAALMERVRTEALRPESPDPFRRPDSRRRGRRRPALRVLQWLVPAALAAAVLLAIGLDDQDTRHADIHEGAAWVVGPGNQAERGRWIAGADDSFAFEVGAELEAGDERVRVEVECGVPANGGVDMQASAERGRVVFDLAPGARLRRDADSTFELLAGRIGVASGKLAEPLSIRHEQLYAEVIGTRFDVTVAEDRMVVVVDEGRVRIGRDGADATSTELGAGRQGLVDADRLLEAAADGRSGGHAFLTPRLAVEFPEGRVEQGTALAGRVRLSPSDAGPVTIAAFDDSRPVFLVRLTGEDGIARHVKVQHSMVEAPASLAGRATLRLTTDEPYDLTLRLPTRDLEPGTWEAVVAYLSYRRHSNGDEWLGRIESDPVRFQVTE